MKSCQTRIIWGKLETGVFNGVNQNQEVTQALTFKREYEDDSAFILRLFSPPKYDKNDATNFSVSLVIFNNSLCSYILNFRLSCALKSVEYIVMDII